MRPRSSVGEMQASMHEARQRLEPICWKRRRLVLRVSRRGHGGR